MKINSFASRLSLKIILMTSLIFILAIAGISIKGAKMGRGASLNYSALKLRYAMCRMENSIKSSEVSMDSLRNALLEMRPYERSRVMMIDENGDYVCNPFSDVPDQGNISDFFVPDYADTPEEVASMQWGERPDGVQILVFPGFRNPISCLKGQLSNGWMMIIINDARDEFANLIFICLLALSIAILGLTVLFFASHNIIHRETKPLKDFALAAGKITDGRFDVPIPELKHKDEIFELGSALSYMQESVTNYIEELKVTTSEKERLAGELDIAKTIQMQMLNHQFCPPAGCGLFASSIPARQVGGDLYDFYVKGKDIYYIVADVSGKGVPAALLMSISISAFRATICNDQSMSHVVSVINNVFCMSNEDNMFITVNAGHINVETGEMEVCNAGHNPIVLIAPDGKASFLTLKSNIACGVLPDFPYQEDMLTLEKGSRLLIYTDGITEAENSSHGQYGEDRLLAFASTHSRMSVSEDSRVIADLTDDVNAFVADAEQFDDMTMMSISI